MERVYQTIIIGAGPAGLIAGGYLENALILDKKKEIGKPVQCGEGLSRRALEMQGIKPDPAWISRSIHLVQRIAPNSKAIGKFHKEAVGYILDRTLFEEFLASQCKAKIQLNSEAIDLEYKDNFWEIKIENSQIFKAKYLIGADGVHSIVRRKVFPENKERIEFIPAIEYLMKLEKEIDAETIKIYFDNEKYTEGYAWIFPKSKNTANIGVGGKRDLSERFSEFLKDTVKRDYGDCRVLENRSGIVPLKNKKFKFFKLNTMLVGDAAGLADPLFKGGMNQAMHSAKISAECILKREIKSYESKIKSMPFADPKLIKASKIFFSFDKQTFSEIGEILEEKGSHYLKTLPGAIKILSKSHIRKNIFKLSKFFTIWWKNRDYLW